MSAAFTAAVQKSHRIAVGCDILQNSSKIGSARLLPSSSVTVDRAAAVRRRCSVQIVDDTGSLLPGLAGDPLMPLGNELRLFRGITYDPTPLMALIYADQPLAYWPLRALSADGTTPDVMPSHFNATMAGGGGSYGSRGPCFSWDPNDLAAGFGGATVIATATAVPAGRGTAGTGDTTLFGYGILGNDGKGGVAGQTALYVIVTDQGGGANTANYALRLGWDGSSWTLQYFFWNGTTWVELNSSAINDPRGDWHSYGVTDDGTNVTFYYDGNQVSTGTLAGTPGQSPLRACIGNTGPVTGGGVQGWYGLLAHVAIWNRVLASSRFSAYASAPSSVTSETFPLGTFQIAQTQVVDQGGKLTILIDGFDRANAVSRAKLQDSYSIASGTALETAIQNLISNAVSGYSYALQPTGYTLPSTVVYNAGDDPWTEAMKLAETAGAELFFDPWGVVILRPMPDPTQQAVVWTYAEGATAIVTDIQREWSNSRTPNIVIRDGGGAGNALVRGIAQDTNANSPTYINGSYGKVVDYLHDPKLTTQAQAQAAAQAILNKAIGNMERCQWHAIPVPAHDVGVDVVQLRRARLKQSANYVLDTLKIPLAHNDLQEFTARLVTA